MVSKILDINGDNHAVTSSVCCFSPSRKTFAQIFTSAVSSYEHGIQIWEFSADDEVKMESKENGRSSFLVWKNCNATYLWAANQPTHWRQFGHFPNIEGHIGWTRSLVPWLTFSKFIWNIFKLSSKFINFFWEFFQNYKLNSTFFVCFFRFTTKF